jgi:hypothetical protein
MDEQFYWMKNMMRNKMDELSNEHWQQNCCENLNKRNKMEEFHVGLS